MSRPSTWPFPAAEIHREATADPLDEARERILEAADEQDEDRICQSCNGTGRSFHGTAWGCEACGGGGTERRK